MKRQTLTTAALSLVLLPAAETPDHAAGGPAPQLPVPGQYNVVVIVLDDQGTEKTGKELPNGTYVPMFGELTDTIQPTCDWLYTLWSEGMKFDNVYAAPLCSPTRAAMLTGRYGSFNGVGNIVPQGNCGGGSIYKPPPYEVYLPELLDLGHSQQPNGVHYAKGAFGKWHLSDRDCDAVERGFDHFEGHIVNNMNEFPCNFGLLGERDHFRWRKVRCDNTAVVCTPSPNGCASRCCWELVDGPPDDTTWSPSVTTTDALDWINSQPANTPFFAWVAYNPPHVPMQVPPETEYGRTTQVWLDFYGYEPGDPPQDQGGKNEAFHRHVVHNAMIESVDREIGRFFDPVTGIDPSRLDDTVVIVVGDNGSDMNQVQPGTINGQPVPPGHGKRSVYELGVRVPMVAWLPPSFPVSHSFAVADGFVNGVDFWRTIAHLTGLNAATLGQIVDQRLTPFEQKSDSVSFFGLLWNGGAINARSRNYSEGYLVNGLPYFPPRNQGIQGRFAVSFGAQGLHRFKYMRVYDGSVGENFECSIAEGTEEFFDLTDNPLEDPAFNLIDTDNPELLVILETLRTDIDAIYAMGQCVQIADLDEPNK